jgi:hypothetical protein
MKEGLVFVALLAVAAIYQAADRPAPSEPAVEQVTAEESAIEEPAAEQDVHYSGCNEVRALGKDPLYRGQPGYSEDMDGDGDGIACEPHRGR